MVGSSHEYLNKITGCVVLPFESPINFQAVLIWSKRRPISSIGQDFLNLVKESVSAE